MTAAAVVPSSSSTPSSFSAVTSKVSAYLQHLQDKNPHAMRGSVAVPDAAASSSPASSRFSALDRRRKRAAQLRANLLKRRSPEDSGTVHKHTAVATSDPTTASKTEIRAGHPIKPFFRKNHSATTVAYRMVGDDDIDTTKGPSSTEMSSTPTVRSSLPLNTSATYVSSSSEASAADVDSAQSTGDHESIDSPPLQPQRRAQAVETPLSVPPMLSSIQTSSPPRHSSAFLPQPELLRHRVVSTDSSSGVPQPASELNHDAEIIWMNATATEPDHTVLSDWNTPLQHYTSTDQLTYISEEHDSYYNDMLSDVPDIDALIAETSQRWKTSTQQIVQNTTTRRLMQQGPSMGPTQSFSSSHNNSNLNKTSPTLILPTPPLIVPMELEQQHDIHQRKIIEQQQAEIEVLRARLGLYPTTQDDMHQHHNHANNDVDQVEQIDDIPVEHIEVQLNDDLLPGDDLTVWSGWTQQPSMRPATPVRAPPLQQRRPDADESSSVAPSHRRVRDYALTLSAANGAVRKALYTGPIQEDHTITGVGVLKFIETGDVYFGEVVNGEMHGLGTFVSKRKKRPLKGTFEHNVFVQWNEV